jgi:glycine betaine/proline transport system substrate-binding protein
VKDVDSLADLRNKSAEFHGRIVGIEPSAGMMGLLKDKVLQEYGLKGSYEVVDGSTPAMLAELKRAYAKKQPVLVTLWSPHWAYARYDLKKLKDPRGAWGKGDGVHTVARRGFAEDNPEAGRWLKDFSMTEQQLTDLEARIQQAGKGKEQDAARAWLADHPGLLDKWAPVDGGAADGKAAAATDSRAAG